MSVRQAEIFYIPTHGQNNISTMALFKFNSSTAPDTDSGSTDRGISNTAAILIKYFKLLLEDARLTAAEKLTVLFSTVTFYALLLVVGTVALVFISIGIGHWLAATVAPELAYLFIAAFYVVVLIVLIVFKRQLLIDPICRFITRLIVEPPKAPKRTESSHETVD